MMEEKADKKQNIWRGRIIRYAPLLLWIGVIFFLSSTQGSMARTSIFVRPVLEFLFPGAPEETLIIYHGYVRKLAHFTAYAILGFWGWRAFINSANRFLQNYWFLSSLLLITIIALLDEFNQSFNAARTGSMRDVGIDICGGLAMLAFIMLCSNLYSPRRSAHKLA